MKYFSMFSGIGGFEYGIECACNKQLTKIEQDREGRNGSIDEVEHDVLPTSRTTALCVGFSEVDKYAKQIYKKHFGGHKDYGDCTKIRWEEVEDFDVLVGGFPCQAFSIAGKRMGFDDVRGTLFFEIARCLREKQPRLCVLENVKGLLSHDKGNTMATIITTLDELGYDLQWQVLNSKNFGVPQNRERVFIIGHLRGTSRPEVFPLGGENQKSCKIYGHDCLKRCYSIDGISPTLHSCGGGNTEGKFAIPVLTPDRPEKRQNGRRFKEDGEPAFTITAQDRHGIFNGFQIRKLTPTECERLQGFPDGWTEEGIYIPETDTRKCAKQETIAIIENNGKYWVGSNWCDRPQKECPRKDMATGVGYELCQDVCKQKTHAEVDACLKAGKNAKGGTLYLIGHTYCCEPCKKVMDSYGIKNVVIGKYPTIKISDSQRYKCLGNAVTTNVITAILERILNK